MCQVRVKLTVFFEEPFWVGVFERCEDGCISVSRVVFGAEPKDYDVYDFLLKRYHTLKFSNPISVDETEEKRLNPKRLQREAKKETQDKGVGTKAQLAIKLQYEANKMERRKKSKEEKEEGKERQFALRQQKKREKHRGH